MLLGVGWGYAKPACDTKRAGCCALSGTDTYTEGFGEPGDGGDDGSDRPAFQPPEDWVAAAKRNEAEAAEELRKQKEAEDQKAQEERLQEAERRRAEEEAVSSNARPRRPQPSGTNSSSYLIYV